MQTIGFPVWVWVILRSGCWPWLGVLAARPGRSIRLSGVSSPPTHSGEERSREPEYTQVHHVHQVHPPHQNVCQQHSLHKVDENTSGAFVSSEKEVRTFTSKDIVICYVRIVSTNRDSLTVLVQDGRNI